MNKANLDGLADKNILITGAGGMLGLAFVEMIQQYAPGANVTALTKEQLDVAEEPAVLECRKYQPNYIIHCAAKVNADWCQENPAESLNIIVNGTYNLVKLVEETDAQILYPQSFLIFDGQASPTDEDTPPSPLNTYGIHKQQAEQLILESVSNGLVVRMAGFFGGREKDKNFVGKILPHIAQLLRDGKDSIEIGDRVWQPTYTNDLAYNCLALLAQSKVGVYNMASHGQASFYELTAEAANILNFNDRIKITPVSAEEVTTNEKAKRPPLVLMENKRLRAEGLDYQRPWQESLAEYLDHDYFRNLFA